MGNQQGRSQRPSDNSKSIQGRGPAQPSGTRGQAAAPASSFKPSGFRMGNAVNKHLDGARRTGACQLSDLKLNELPSELFTISNVRTLEAARNKLKALPGSIGQLSQLRKVSLDSNQLQVLPPQFCSLSKLESLKISDNLLTGLPQAFIQLRSLRDVNLSGNRITLFPEGLCSLEKLDSLDLSRNKIEELPDALSGLQVTELNLNCNQLRHLPVSLTGCKRLKVLRLEENCLPLDAFTSTILKESTFNLLSFDGNLFESKALHRADGYEEYMERYSASRRKMG